jgi:hypothetical protein
VTVVVSLNGNTVNGGITDIDGNIPSNPLNREPMMSHSNSSAIRPKNNWCAYQSGKITELNAEMLAGSN